MWTFSASRGQASLKNFIGSVDATAKDVLQTVFDHMYKVVQKNDLVNKFKAQGLTLYQGLTMASIVERELSCEDKPTVERKNRCYQYQRGIAQVFIARYKKNMQLGSDVTFIVPSDALPEGPVRQRTACESVSWSSMN